MSNAFYSQNEENTFESLNNYEYLLEYYSSKPPTLEEALIELFRNGGLSKKEAKEIYDHLYLTCNEKVNNNWSLIKEQNKDISKNDALTISSYTYEPKTMYEKFSPYRLLNTNLVLNNRKSGVQNAEKYLFLLLSALRRMTKCKKQCLFRCINCKVKLEKDSNNSKYVPYKIGNNKVFWAFTSTSDDEKVAETFLGNGTGTKYKIVGDDLWGYDITLFNVCGEKEIILEPERKYMIKEVKQDKIIEVTCEIIDDFKILGICDKKDKIIVSKYIFSVKCPVNYYIINI